MKIQLDTVNKIIKLENKVNLKELVELLDKFLPNNEWKDFDLETNTTITNFFSPYIVEKVVPEQPYYKQLPWYYGDDTRENIILCKGQYNIEC